MRIDQDILNRIKQINWFTNCGQTLQKEIQIRYINVDNWKEAEQNYQDSNWENTTLAARNELTVFLHNKYRDQYSKWNSLVKEARMFIEEEVIPKVEIYSEKNELDKVFIDCVKWDILNAIMESTYSKCNHGPAFFLELLNVYESGNFPCGWEGKWPKGSLIIY